MVEQFDIQDPARHETVVAESVSFEAFLSTYAEQHAEWLMGKVILIVSNNTQHQRILGFLHHLLGFYLGLTSLGKIYLAGVPMFRGSDEPAREPDLLVILNDHLNRIKDNYLDGPADIAVEIVSPESSRRDHGDKLDEYEAAGVPEYWLFDPLRKQALIYEIGEEGRYNERALDAQGRITSGILSGFALDPALLWQDDFPQGMALVELVQQMLDSATNS